MHALHRQLLIALVAAVSLVCCMARAAGGPRLQGQRSEPCLEALDIAQHLFRSAKPSLIEPLEPLPATVRSIRLLSNDVRGLDVEDAIAADPDVFEKLPLPEIVVGPPPRSFYWQRQAIDGVRIVVRELSRGWRGDMYFVDILAQDVTPQAYLQAHRPSTGRLEGKPILQDSWRSPTVFRAASGTHWLLHQGEPWGFMQAWTVHTIGHAGAQIACTVHFRPDVNAGIDLLPPEVRRLERLLDRTMGWGKDEGTLQPTARLRASAQRAWDNAALRPWAIEQPFSSRAEVNSGLSAWATKNQDNRQLLAAIRAQEAPAQRALARYYTRVFNRSPAEAKAAAAFAVDAAIRHHYAFPIKKPEDPTDGPDRTTVPNPWSTR